MAMGSSRLLFFIALINFALIFSSAQYSLIFSTCSDRSGSFTNSSTYEANLNTLLSSLSSVPANDYGFYNMSVGRNSDRVNGIALCRGDVNPDVCVNCINNATTMLTNRCPNRIEAAITFDYCKLRYSNRSILGVLDMGDEYFLWNGVNVTNPVSFNETLSNVLLQLIQRAASGGSLRKFATGNAIDSHSQPIYALVQCTPDLSQEDCTICLERSFQQIPQKFAGERGGRLFRTSCYLQFEMQSFYNDSPDSPPLSLPSPTPPFNKTTNSNGNKNNTSRIVIAVVIPTAIVVILIICIYLFLRARKTKETLENMDKEIISAEFLEFDFGTIRIATNNFSDGNKLGQGGFGVVYKGSLSSGQDIAVKRLSRESGQGDLEFKNEVLLVAKLQHRSLVRLLGFSLERSERLLVYEFVQNGSLDRFIFDPKEREQLDWEQRYKIIEGIVRGLLYLHQDSRLRIIHRDLKASNVLLDADMNPKIADFGMARLFLLDETQGNTNRIVGTYGYMAPEYAVLGQFSIKSDVFSFGVLVLEIVTGRKNKCFQDGENEEYLLSYAWKNWRKGATVNLIDPTLRISSKAEMTRCIHMALLCVQKDVVDRPTMASVVIMLNTNSLTLPVPSQPAFFMDSTIQSDLSSSSGYTSRVTDHSNDEISPLSDK